MPKRTGPMDQVWVRCGDQDDYHGFDDLNGVAEYLAQMGTKANLNFCNPLGVVDRGDYQGNNYVSIYYGGVDRGNVGPGLTVEELAWLNERLRCELRQVHNG
jgi:hypothetical protein